MNGKSLIDPGNLQAWTLAAFVLALLALVAAIGGIYRTNTVAVATQVQLLSLNKKVEGQAKANGAAAVAASPAAATAQLGAPAAAPAATK